MEMQTPPKQEVAAANPYAAAAAVVSSPPAAPPAALSGAELRAAVLELLRDSSVGPEGLGQDVIAEKLRAASGEVQSILAGLVDDGELYHTLNEQTFAAV